MKASGLNNEKRRERISDWLDAFSIPKEVPKELRGAILPGEAACPEAFGRIAVRTLHTLLVRSPVETIVLVDEGNVTPPATAAIDSRDEWALDSGAIATDQQWRREFAREFEESMVIEQLGECTTLQEIASWLVLLAPGVRVVALRLDREADVSASEYGARLGRVLGDAKVAVVATTLLTRYGPTHSFVPAGLGPSGKLWMEENDTRVIERIRALDAEGVITDAAAQKSAENANAIALAIGSARPRDGWSGHVIEYTDTHSESRDPIFTDGIGMVGIVF